MTETKDKRIFHGVDVKRFQYEEYATNLSDKQINLQELISQSLFDNKQIDMNCLMINIEKDTQRYERTIEEFKKVSISNFSHLKATYWKERNNFCNDLTFVLDFLKDFNSEINPHQIMMDDFSFINDSGVHIQDGPLGCYISHLRAMIYGWSNFNDYTIICEDDIYIANTEIIEEYIKQVPNDWDIVMLNACSKNKLYDSNFYKFDDEFHSCHFYIVKNSSFPTIFKGMYPIIDQVDVLVSNLRNELNIYNIQESVYQRNISTNTQNNLYVIFNSPHYNQIRENIKEMENGLFNLSNLILPNNEERNKIIVQDLMYDVFWDFVLNIQENYDYHESKETYQIDLTEYSDFPDFDKILNNMRFVLQCSRKGIKGDKESLDLMSVFIHTLINFSLHDNNVKALGFGSTSHTYRVDNKVIKKYNRKLRWITEDHDDSKLIFNKELELLKKINSYNLEPKLISYNTEDLTLTLNYCGESLYDNFNLPDDWKEQITYIFSEYDKIGIFYPEFRLQNILVLDNKITFVDYGLSKFNNESNSNNLNIFLNNLEKLNKKLLDVRDRNTRLQLITTFLKNLDY